MSEPLVPYFKKFISRIFLSKTEKEELRKAHKSLQMKLQKAAPIYLIYLQ